MNKKMRLLLAVFFLIISFMFINPIIRTKRSNYSSNQLKMTTSVIDEHTKRTDYIDSSGRITIAADLGYATMVVTQTEKGRLEQFYDKEGHPIRRGNGFYAVLREYDKQGNNIRNIYLDPEGKPEKTTNGYAIEEREYNDKKLLISVRYYDTEGNPTASPYFGFGRINEYDKNDRNTKTTYINESNDPLRTKLGYATIVRRYYPEDNPWKNKVESEFYFDETGKPIALSLGQYGVHKEYNEKGQEAVLTYLNADGQPVITNKGYTTVACTYQANNSVATELYYDLDGKPFSLSEGQYGIKREDGKTIYLNKDGNEILNLRTILYNHSWIVIVIATAVIVFSAIVGRKMNIVLFFLCICVIIYLTLMFRDGNETNKTSFLWHYKKFFSSREARAEIMKNIWLFIPLGAILYHLYPKKIILLVPVLLSLVIEGTQYITGTGYCELDDVISNSIGGWIGFYSGKVTTVLFLRINNWKQKHSV